MTFGLTSARRVGMNAGFARMDVHHKHRRTMDVGRIADAMVAAPRPPPPPPPPPPPAPPAPSFGTNPTSGGVVNDTYTGPQTYSQSYTVVKFNGEPGTPPYTYVWRSGDGRTGTGATASTQVITSGKGSYNKTISWTVTDSAGRSFTCDAEDYVFVS